MGASLFNCPILSESRAEERREDESKDPESVSPTMPFQGVSTQGPYTFFFIDWPRNSISRPQCSARSSHRGFIFSISAIFFSLRQPFNCRSRRFATYTSSYSSYYTSRLHLYFFVNPSISPDLCWKMRASIKPVMPM